MKALTVVDATPTQQRLWLVDQLSPGSSLNNLAFGIDIDGALDVSALRRALQQIVDRHDILRSRLALDDDGLRLLIPERLHLELNVERLPESDTSPAELDGRTELIGQSPIDTSVQCLRLVLLEVSPIQHRLVLVAHHAVFDGWSLPVFLRELAEQYTAASGGTPAPTRPVRSFADHAALRSTIAPDEVGAEYWAGALAGIEGPLFLPYDFRRPSTPQFRGRAHRFNIPGDVLQRARATGASESASAFMCGLVAFQVVLTQLTGQDSFTVGTPVSDRPDASYDDVIGPFVNVVALPCDTSNDPTLRELLLRVRRAISSTYAHADVPLQTVVDALPRPLGPRHSPAFDVVYAQHAFSQPTLALADGLVVRTFPIDTGVAGNDLGLFVTPGAADDAEGLLQYDTDVFHHETAVAIAERFVHVLDLIGRRPDLPLSRVSRPRPARSRSGPARRLHIEADPTGRALLGAAPLGYREVPATSEQRSLRTEPPTTKHTASFDWSGTTQDLKDRMATEVSADPALRCRFTDAPERTSVMILPADGTSLRRPNVADTRQPGEPPSDDSPLQMDAVPRGDTVAITVRASPLVMDAAGFADVVTRLVTGDHGIGQDDASYLDLIREQGVPAPYRRAATNAWISALSGSAAAFAEAEYDVASGQPHWQKATLDRELVAAVGELGDRHGLSSDEVVATALGVLLARHQRRSLVSLRLRHHQVVASGPAESFPAVVAVDPERCFDDLLGEVRQGKELALEHGPSVLEHCAGPLGGDPRRRCLIAVDSWPAATPTEHGRRTTSPRSWYPAIDAALQAGIVSAKSAYVVTLAARNPVDHPLATSAAAHLPYLLAALVAGPQQPLRTHATMAPADRAAAIARFDATHASRDRTAERASTLVGQVAAWALRFPHALAVLDSGGGQLTYTDLVARADQVARGMRDLGVAPGDRVALVVGNGPESVVLALGVLAAGATFAFLDPQDETPGLTQRLDVLDPRVLVHEPGWRTSLAPATIPHKTTYGDTLSRTPPHDGVDGLAAAAKRWAAAVAPQDLAYVAFTSGSTGRPKGVGHTHADMVEFSAWQARAFPVTPGARVAQLATLTFDVAYCEIFGALCHGATLCTRSTITPADVSSVVGWICRDEVNIVQAIPRLMRELLREANESKTQLDSLRTVVSVGERLPGDVAEAVSAHAAHPVRLVNIYGPTEAIAATWQDATDWFPDQEIPIGAAIDGRHVLVLDTHGQPCAPGAVGEVWIESAALPGTYLGTNMSEDHDATGLAYLPLPEGALRGDSAADTGPTAYRSGDLARVGNDGRLYFVGRTDHQVKVSGVRVELEAVEAACMDEPTIRDCAVRLFEDGQEQELVAFVVASTELDVDSLRNSLRAKLVHAAVPTRFVSVPELPRLANGKVARSSLRRPEKEKQVAGDPPANSLEVAVAACMSEVLPEGRQIGRESDFFALGGNSLQAVRLLNRLRSSVGLNLSLRELFANPSVAGLAAAAPLDEAANNRGFDSVLARLERRAEELLATEDDETLTQLEAELGQLSDEQVDELLRTLAADEQETT